MPIARRDARFAGRSFRLEHTLEFVEPPLFEAKLLARTLGTDLGALVVNLRDGVALAQFGVRRHLQFELLQLRLPGQDLRFAGEARSANSANRRRCSAFASASSRRAATAPWETCGLMSREMVSPATTLSPARARILRRHHRPPRRSIAR